jgi:general secretion pathway protein J
MSGRRFTARSGASGLTLIELLVALVVFGVFAVVAYAGLARMLEGRARLAAEQRVWQDLSSAFLRISDDLANARARRVRDVAGFFLPAFSGRPYDSRALAEPSLELTRGGELNYGEGVHSDLRRVAWQLRDGQLLRITWPVLDRAPTSKPLDSALIGEVETFEVKFQSQSGGPVDTWPPEGAQPDALPSAVEVTLAVKGVGRFRRVFLVNR